MTEEPGSGTLTKLARAKALAVDCPFCDCRAKAGQSCISNRRVYYGVERRPIKKIHAARYALAIWNIIEEREQDLENAWSNGYEARAREKDGGL